MREMGVRELKRSLSEALDAVGRGEQIRVTRRGRALADIVPARATDGDDQLRQMVADGRLVAPARARPKTPPKPVETSQSASALVLSERDAER